MNLQGANILITGAAKRVGRACAVALAAQGANIAVHYHRSAKEATETCAALQRFGVKALTFRADLARVAQLRAMAAEAWKTFGGIDVLINSASIFPRTPLEQVTERIWDQTLDTNLKGCFFLARELGMRMAKRGRGKIINIADWAGERPYKNYLPYCISKAGVIAMTKGLAKTLAPRVQVNAISPGPVLLPPSISAADKKAVIRGTPLGRIGSPEDIANTARFLIEGTDFMTGSIVAVDGGRLIA